MIWFPPGSSTTWIFGKDVDIINETGGKLGKLQHRGAHSNYVRGAVQIPDVCGQPQYEDGSHHIFDLHRGPFYLKGEASCQMTVLLISKPVVQRILCLASLQVLLNILRSGT
ncbi:hypothetical protein B0H10DRAFT_1941807 [Mycena sp. CBHHK59/15]|nr:hypothetical protein B0H10DRAFT_1941807 [Mycena sp. CBHHK59/15]